MKELIGFAVIFIISTLMFWDLVHDIDKMSCQNKSQRPRDLDYSEAFELLRDEEKERHKPEINKTGMKKIDALINTLTALQLADDRPAVDRICESLIQSLREVEQEHEAEIKGLVAESGLLRSQLERDNLAINEQMAKVQEADDEIKKLEEQLKAMSDLANSAMADAQKWQNAYLKLRAETPMLPQPLPGRVWYLDGKPVDESLIMSQQAETAREAQEDRTPRNGYHKYHIKYYNYGDHRWHETELWCKGVKDVENWVLGVCGGTIPVYDCKVVA